MPLPTKRITVSIIEDDLTVVESMIEIMRLQSDVECIGIYGDAETGLKEIPKSPPQILLMDINLPGMSGLDCLIKLSPLIPDTQILMLTVRNDPKAIFSALANGAHGYLLKPFKTAQLTSALHDVTSGAEPMRQAIAKHVLNFFQEPTTPEPAPLNTEGLSPREIQILKYLVAGHAYKQIADELQIAYGTVHVHIARIYKKMHVQSRGQAVAKAIRKGD